MAATKTRKPKVTLCKWPHVIGPKQKYKVKKLTNTLEPEIGEMLTETEVQHMIDSGDYNIEIVPWKKGD